MTNGTADAVTSPPPFILYPVSLRQCLSENARRIAQQAYYLPPEYGQNKRRTGLRQAQICLNWPGLGRLLRNDEAAERFGIGDVAIENRSSRWRKTDQAVVMGYWTGMPDACAG
jgi:hypothetical protein